MYDTVNMTYLANWDSVNDMENTLKYLTGCGDHRYESGIRTFTGYLPSPSKKLGHDLKVSVNSRSIKVGKASLAKWYYGDPLKILTLENTKLCIECIGDILHIPMQNSLITRLDFGYNLQLCHNIALYIEHLGDLDMYKRVQVDNEGIYYNLNNRSRSYVLYDKGKELRSNKEFIPEELADSNILRLEFRLTKRIHSYLKMPTINASMLYDKQLFSECLRLWARNYRKIRKINDYMLDFNSIYTKSLLYDAGIASLVKERGGMSEIIRQIKESQAIGLITRGQAFKLKERVIKACESKIATIKSPLISELDEKIEDAVREIKNMNDLK